MIRWNPAYTAHKSLIEIAETAADAAYFGHGERDEQMAFLELAAAEINRRHGSASIQTGGQVGAALRWIADWDHTDPADITSHDVTMTVRALGVILDQAAHDSWVTLLVETGRTREDVVENLYELALHEGLRQGFDHDPRIAVLVPSDADEMVAPF